MLFVPTARAQRRPCCSITSINTRAETVAAKVNATGEVFDFKVTNPALLQSLKVDEAIYANFTTRQVSVDGRSPCGTIVSIGPPKGSQTPNAPSTSAPPVPQPESFPKPSVGTPPSGPAPALSGANPACCSITSINVPTRVVIAKIKSTGQVFNFSVPDSVPIQDLQVGQTVWANFKLRQVSLNGLASCCPIVSVGAGEVVTSPETAPPSAPGNLGLPTPTSVVLTPTTVTGGASINGTVNLTGAAPQGGIQVELATGDAAVATVPQTVVIPQGANSGTFTVGTKPVPLQHAGKTSSDSPVPVVISASGARSKLATATQTVTQSATLDVLPPVVKNLEGDSPSALSFTSAIEPLQIRSCTRTKGAKSAFQQTGDTPTQACVQLSGPAADESPHSVFPFPTKFRGAAVALSSSNPHMASVPATVFVPEGKETEQFAISTIPVVNPTTVDISAHRTQSDAKTLQLTVLPPALQDLSCTPPSVTGGNIFSCTVTLTGPAYGLPNNPPLNVNLQSCPDPLATCMRLPVPSSKTVPTLAVSTPPFSIATPAVPLDNPTVIAASFAGVTKIANLTILAPRPRLFQFPNGNSVQGGNSSTAWVDVDGTAPPGGMYITLSSDNPAVAAVPPNVYVPANMMRSENFPIQTKPVNSDTTVYISAAYDSTAPTASAPFKVKAPPPTPLPDLYLSFPFYADSSSCSNTITPSAGQTSSFNFYLCIIVGNSGTAAAGSTEVTGTMNGNDNSSVPFSIQVPSLKAGQRLVFSTSSAMAASSGVEYVFNACVNRSQSIKESDYSNNCAAWQLGFGF